MFAGAPVRCAGLAELLKQAAARDGASFFDAGTVMSVDETDGIHWSAEAHRSLGLALVDVVKGLA